MNKAVKRFDDAVLGLFYEFCEVYEMGDLSDCMTTKMDGLILNDVGFLTLDEVRTALVYKIPLNVLYAYLEDIDTKYNLYHYFISFKTK